MLNEAEETIDKTEKRRPIRQKVQTLVLVISLASLLLTSTMGIFSMVFIKSDSETAMTRQMELRLTNIVNSRAKIAEGELGRYASCIRTFVTYLHELYRDPGAVVGRPISSISMENANIVAMQRCFANRNFSLEDVREEMLLLGNVEHIWRPIMTEYQDVLNTIYLGTKSGLMLSYDAQSQNALPEDGDTETYYDYFGSTWYRKAKSMNRLCFTDVYQDAFARGMVITCAAPFYDANNEFAGVVAVDIRIDDLYRSIMEMNMGEGAYAFLIDREGNIVDPTTSDGADARSIYYDKDIGLETASQILRNKSGITLSKEGIYYTYASIGGVDWKLCICVPEALALEPVRSMNRSIIITIILFFLAFVVVIAFVILGSREFADRLTEPIIALEDDVERISDGDLDYRAKIYDNDEIGDLARSFNNMAVSMKEYIMDFATVTAERERIGTELNIATKIQEELLPCVFPPFPERKEFSIYATMNPAKEVGGDFYDFFFIDSDHLALVMADVSGKGVPAALFMAIAKTLIKNRSQMGGTPSEILAAVNDQLCEESKAELFVTVWLGILEISTGKMIASNAGHEYPVLRRADGAYRLIRLPNSPAVATLEGMKFREDKFTLHPGDSLFLYTDGVAEATHVERRDGKEELYGTERMIEALNRHGAEPVEELLVSMKREVDAFAGDSPQFDDITMLALQYYGKEKKGES